MNKRGFTLIELLAVIIILGLLMLIAIPSVTTYINGSRRDAYITTARQYIRAATNMVNEGKHDFFDTDTTYYIPVKCLPLETGGNSPFGEFDKAYVLVTYDNDSFQYYWISRDVTGQGIKDATLSNDLKSDLIVANNKPEDIRTDITIGGRSKAKVMDDNSCELGTADSYSYVVDEDKIVDVIYHDDSTSHVDGYTVIPSPDFDFATLPDFNIYSPLDHTLDNTFRNTVKDVSAEMFYGYYLYYGQDNYAKVKLLYNLPKFKKNSDGSIHTVKQFISRKDSLFYGADGTNSQFSYACSITNTTGHIADCDVRPTNFEMKRCINDGTQEHANCMNIDRSGTTYMYYILDNGDVLQAWQTARYNGATTFTYTNNPGGYRLQVADLNYTFSKYK
jgi:prepilin-type N-terminal cleavage/methylation domain-containing protein